MMETGSKPIILIIENAVAVTGSVKSAIRNSLVLRNEFEFLFVLPKHSLAKSFVEGYGFVVYEMSFLEISMSWKSVLYIPVLFFNVFILRKIISKSKANLIVGNDFYNMVPAFNNLFGGRTPYITFVRFIPSRFPRYLVDIWCFLHFRFAKSVIAVSQAVKNKLREHKKITMIYNELPIEEGFGYCEYDKMSNRILCLSNYIPGKGLEFAIQAFAVISKRYPQWHLRFVGSDMGMKKNRGYKRNLKIIAANLDVLHKIEWNGFTNDVVHEYKKAAIVLNFSDSESFSLTCIEAMFIGRPVIATRCGGPEEIITDSVDGYLVPLRNLPEMIAALDRLLIDEERREAIGKQAHTSVSEKFSLENTTYKLLPVYEAAIGLNK